LSCVASSLFLSFSLADGLLQSDDAQACLRELRILEAKPETGEGAVLALRHEDQVADVTVQLVAVLLHIEYIAEEKKSTKISEKVENIFSP
jgi:hypothetical protein